MADLIEECGEAASTCPICGKEASVRTFILKGPRPHKVYSVTVCSECPHTETAQSDYEILDYGVLLTCDFTIAEDATPAKGGKNSNLLRMAFVNSNAKVAVLNASGKLLIEFTADTGNIDCVQGLVQRGIEILAYAEKDVSAGLRGISDELAKILDGTLGFKLVIKDNTGFSKVCPVGMEYTDVHDWELDAFDDPCLKYEKVEKEVPETPVPIPGI